MTEDEKRAKAKAKAEAKEKKLQSVDMTLNYSRFAQQIVKDEFIRRVKQLNVPDVTD